MARFVSLAFATVCVSVILVPQATASHTLRDSQESVVKAWLSTHPGYRQATDVDCDCAEDIAMMRQGYGGQWKPVPDYHPYSAVGDFNSDGLEDFAVVVIETKKQAKQFTLLVFNGPFSSGSAPAYVEANSDMRHTGMFFGPPRPKPYRLIIGGFESDGYVLEPKGKTYRTSDAAIETGTP